MNLTLLGGRSMLAAIFGVADLSKLADRQGSRMALVGFGLRDHWAG